MCYYKILQNISIIENNKSRFFVRKNASYLFLFKSTCCLVEIILSENLIIDS